jgi:hypothetical protein
MPRLIVYWLKDGYGKHLTTHRRINNYQIMVIGVMQLLGCILTCIKLHFAGHYSGHPSIVVETFGLPAWASCKP